MEQTSDAVSFLIGVGFLVCILIIIEIIAIANRAYKIFQESLKQSAQLEQQTRYLAAISTNMAKATRQLPEPAAVQPPPAA